MKRNAGRRRGGQLMPRWVADGMPGATKGFRLDGQAGMPMPANALRARQTPPPPVSYRTE